jgi:hypothetical protein
MTNEYALLLLSPPFYDNMPKWRFSAILAYYSYRLSFLLVPGIVTNEHCQNDTHDSDSSQCRFLSRSLICLRNPVHSLRFPLRWYGCCYRKKSKEQGSQREDASRGNASRHGVCQRLSSGSFTECEALLFLVLLLRSCCSIFCTSPYLQGTKVVDRYLMFG